MKNFSDPLREQHKFLVDLISFQEPISALRKRDKIGRFCDNKPDNFNLITLTRTNIIEILKRFLHNDLTAEDVYEWSDEFVVRDLVEWEPGYHDIISEILHSLSTDFDHGKNFNENRAKQFIQELETAQYTPTEE